MTRYQLKLDKPQVSLSNDGQILGFTVNESDSETIINVQGAIGDEWTGITASEMVDRIQQIKTPIVMRINSPGGYVSEALDIYHALVDHPHNVRADIVANAWSAATIITSAADEVRIASAAFYGVHRSWSGFVVAGNAEEMAAQIPQIESYISHLEKVDVAISEIIAQRTGLNSSDVMEWMIGPEGVDGTEFQGQEAVDVGLVDSLIPDGRKNIKEPIAAKIKLESRKRMLRLLREKSKLYR